MLSTSFYRKGQQQPKVALVYRRVGILPSRPAAQLESQPSAGFLGECKRWLEYPPLLLQEDAGSKQYQIQQVTRDFTFSYLEAEQIQLL